MMNDPLQDPSLAYLTSPIQNPRAMGGYDPRRFTMGEPPLWAQILGLLGRFSGNSPEFQSSVSGILGEEEAGRERKAKEAIRLGYTAGTMPESIKEKKGPFGIFGSTDRPPTPQEQMFLGIGAQLKQQQQMQQFMNSVKTYKMLQGMQDSHMKTIMEFGKTFGADALEKHLQGEGVTGFEEAIKSLRQKELEKTQKESEKEKRRGLFDELRLESAGRARQKFQESEQDRQQKAIDKQKKETDDKLKALIGDTKENYKRVIFDLKSRAKELKKKVESPTAYEDETTRQLDRERLQRLESAPGLLEEHKNALIKALRNIPEGGFATLHGGEQGPEQPLGISDLDVPQQAFELMKPAEKQSGRIDWSGIGQEMGTTPPQRQTQNPFLPFLNPEVR